MERVVLDSSVWIAIQRGAIDLTKILNGRFEVLLPAMVAAELRFESAQMQPGTHRHQRALDFLAFVEREAEFAPFGLQAVDKYVELLLFCRREGVPRSVQDLMIAATAIANGAMIKSFDKKALFEKLPNLRVIE